MDSGQLVVTNGTQKHKHTIWAATSPASAFGDFKAGPPSPATPPPPSIKSSKTSVGFDLYRVFDSTIFNVVFSSRDWIRLAASRLSGEEEDVEEDGSGYGLDCDFVALVEGSDRVGAIS